MSWDYYSDTKKCSKCNVIKDLDEFYINKIKTKKGIRKVPQSQCKECAKETARDYKRTKIGRLQAMYNAQVGNSKLVGRKPPEYSKEEFVNAVMKMPLYHELYDNWKNSGFEKRLTPSIDRIDNSKTYLKSNIQLMTWEENERKAREDQKNGILNAGRKYIPVIHIDENGNEINRYFSIAEASRRTGIDKNIIRNHISGKLKKKKPRFKLDLDRLS